MAGIPESKAEAAEAQGRGLAKHLRVSPESERGRRIIFGTKIAKGWRSSRWHSFHGRPIRKAGIRDAVESMKGRGA